MGRDHSCEGCGMGGMNAEPGTPHCVCNGPRETARAVLAGSVHAASKKQLASMVIRLCEEADVLADCASVFQRERDRAIQDLAVMGSLLATANEQASTWRTGNTSLRNALKDAQRECERLRKLHGFQSREPGCECHQEIGDSPCSVHPSDDEPQKPSVGEEA